MHTSMECNIFHAYDQFLETRSHDELGVLKLLVVGRRAGKLIGNICPVVWICLLLGILNSLAEI